MKILLVGSFHGKNKGDEAIALAEIHTLRSLFSGCQITIASQNPDYFAKAYAAIGVAAVRISNPLSVVRAMASADAMVVGGGGLFFEPKPGHIFQLHKNQSLVWPLLCRVAQLFRTPTILWGVGSEPISTRLGQRMIGWGLNAAKAILVRDPKTRDLFVSYGVTSPITIVSDSAWLLQVPQSQSSQHQGNTYRIGVSPHFGIAILEDATFVENYHKTFAQQLDRFAAECATRKDIEFVFMPMHIKDIAECEAIQSHMHYTHTRIQAIHTITPVEIVSLLGSMDMQIGMRMHGTILATIAGTPSVSIVYANKVTETVDTIYGNSPVAPEQLSLRYQDINTLSQKMRICADNEVPLRAHLGTFRAQTSKRLLAEVATALHSLDLGL